MKKKILTAEDLKARKEKEEKMAAEQEAKKEARRESIQKSINILEKADPKTVTDGEKAVLEAFQKAIAETIADAMDAMDTGIADQLKEFVKALEEVELKDADLQNFRAEMKADLLKVLSSVEKGGKSAPGSEKITIRDLVGKEQESLENLGKNNNAAVKIGFKMFEKNAPDFMGVVSSVNGGSGSPYLPAPTIAAGVVPVMQTNPKIFDAVVKKPISTPTLVTINRNPVDGDFEWTIEGAIKPFLKFDYETEMVTARKLAARTKTSREALSDIHFIQADTEMVLEDTYKRRLSAEILNGDGQKNTVDGDFRIFGLKHYAPKYVQVCMNGSVEEPGISEVLKAAATQIRNMGAEGALVAFVNPCDWAIEAMRKDTSGALLDVSKLLDGITVVETGEIATGEFFIGDLGVFTLYVYDDFTIHYGYSNDDFDRNLVSVVAEGRVFGFVSANNVGALCADSYASVKSLIAK